jgi:hypothetical protein
VMKNVVAACTCMPDSPTNALTPALNTKLTI